MEVGIGSHMPLTVEAEAVAPREVVGMDIRALIL